MPVMELVLGLYLYSQLHLYKYLYLYLSPETVFAKALGPIVELAMDLYLYSQLHLYLYTKQFFCNMEGSSSCFEVGNGFVFVFKVAFVFVYKQVFAILRPVVELVMDSSVLSASLCTPCQSHWQCSIVFVCLYIYFQLNLFIHYIYLKLNLFICN